MSWIRKMNGNDLESIARHARTIKDSDSETASSVLHSIRWGGHQRRRLPAFLLTALPTSFERGIWDIADGT